MAARGNVSHQLRILLRHPSQDEESPSYVELLEDDEQFLRVVDHSGLTRSPAITMYVGCQRRNMKIIFHVNSQSITYVHDGPLQPPDTESGRRERLAIELRLDVDEAAALHDLARERLHADVYEMPMRHGHHHRLGHREMFPGH